MDLLTPDVAIDIPDIGPIGQHYSYLHDKWEKGVPYFARDYLLDTLANPNLSVTQRDRNARLLHVFNSNILQYEQEMSKSKPPTVRMPSWDDDDGDWRMPKNPVPLTPYRQNARRSPSPLNTPNPYQVLTPPPEPSPPPQPELRAARAAAPTS